jgi:OOP family OmpA-OmpF porin
MTMKKMILAGLIAVGAATGANAEGFYVGGSLGSASVAGIKKYDQGNQALASAEGVSITSEYTDRAGSLKLFGGYAVNKYFEVEAGFTDFGKQKSDLNDPTGPFSESSKWDITAFFVEAVGILPLSDSFSLLGKIGYAQTKSELTYTNSNGAVGNINASKTGGGIKYGIGAEYVIAKNYAIRAEFEKYADVESMYSDTVADTNGAMISKKADIDVLSVGFNYKF